MFLHTESCLSMIGGVSVIVVESMVGPLQFDSGMGLNNLYVKAKRKKKRNNVL